MEQSEIRQIKSFARDIRVETIKEIAHLGVGHIGGSMSIADLLAVLYKKEMSYDPKSPRKEGRDRLIVSKGHSGPAVYATLALSGFFPVSELMTLNEGGTKLPSHCDMNLTTGIDFTTGSLGQGASAACGIALGERIKGSSAFTYLIIGDGESQEGQIWEMAMTAAHYKVDHLITFLDYNKKQIDGYVEDVMSLGDVKAKWESFGWETQFVEGGNDVNQIVKAIENAKRTPGKPHMIILNTVKSKGYLAGERTELNHNLPVSEQDAEESVKALLALEF